MTQILTILVTSLVTFAIALLPLAWAWHYDRYKKLLTKQDFWESWISALLTEVEIQQEQVEGLKELIEKNILVKSYGIVTHRINDDLFRLAREQIIASSRSPHIFSTLTQTLQISNNANRMLNRHEKFVYDNMNDLSSVHDTTKFTPLLEHQISSLMVILKSSLSNLEQALTMLREKLENERHLFTANRPKLIDITSQKHSS